MSAGDGRSLASKHCVPCTGGTPPLPADEIAPLLAQLGDGWDVRDGVRLRKTFRFGDFAGAVAFVNVIALIAEAEGHHPDLLVSWGKVRVDLQTHVIKGLTESDFIMAAKIDEAAAK
jgi:4a-hydroxytetrahydrobiopterin dehydratase